MEFRKITEERLEKMGLTNLRQTLPTIMEEMIKDDLIEANGFPTEKGKELLKQLGAKFD